MRALIVDDMKYKQEEVIYALKKFDITDYEITESIKDTLSLLKQKRFDIIITDLGLPRIKGEDITDSLEGLNMLIGLYCRKIFIPTIIYSTTNIPSSDLTDLRYVYEYPFLGQATNIDTLTLLLQIYLENNKNQKESTKIRSTDSKITRARVNKNSITDSN
ncbi:MAG: response regulator [Bacilli bacterium]|jgi:CheY-like chemotaxis protein|nr:response regulator [Bacilli bacterium]